MRMFAFSVRKSARSPPRLGIGAEPGKHVGRERGEGGGVEEAWVRADAPVASRRGLAERSNRPPEHSGHERKADRGVGNIGGVGTQHSKGKGRAPLRTTQGRKRSGKAEEQD
jgi:hypothetical protein